MADNVWELALQRLRSQIEPEEYRRWLLGTAYASDSGDLITVWVPAETDRRHLITHYQDVIDRAIQSLGRRDTRVRFVVAGLGEDEDEDLET